MEILDLKNETQSGEEILSFVFASGLLAGKRQMSVCNQFACV